MKDIEDNRNAAGFGGYFAIDTTIVLFFLALQFGRTLQLFAVDGLLMAITTGMVLVLPYVLPSQVEKPAFRLWVAGRIAVTILGILIGTAFGRSLGVLLPETLKFVPMTLLIVAAMVSCYVQFYGLMKLRLAK